MKITLKLTYKNGNINLFQKMTQTIIIISSFLIFQHRIHIFYFGIFQVPLFKFLTMLYIRLYKVHGLLRKTQNYQQYITNII